MKAIIKKILELSSIIFGLALLAGFLVVNIYLSFFGFWDFQFLKTEYVSAGLSFIFHIALTLIIIAMLYAGITRIRVFFKAQQTNNKFINFILTVLSSLSLVLWGIFAVSLNAFIFTYEYEVFFILLAITYSVISLLLIGSLLWAILTINKAGATLLNSQKNQWKVGILLPLTTIGILALITVYAFYVYPFLPKYIGGGEPAKAELVFKSTPTYLKTIHANEPISVNIISQTEKSILFMFKEEIFLINYDNIDAIQYFEKQPGFISAFRYIAR